MKSTGSINRSVLQSINLCQSHTHPLANAPTFLSQARIVRAHQRPQEAAPQSACLSWTSCQSQVAPSLWTAKTRCRCLSFCVCTWECTSMREHVSVCVRVCVCSFFHNMSRTWVAWICRLPLFSARTCTGCTTHPDPLTSCALPLGCLPLPSWAGARGLSKIHSWPATACLWLRLARFELLGLLFFGSQCSQDVAARWCAHTQMTCFHVALQWRWCSGLG